MHQPTHHIRILAGFEIHPNHDYNPILERDQAQALADALAQDLSKQLPDDTQTMLVVAGVVVDASQAMRPGFPMWQALEQLAKPTLTNQGLSNSVMAIGAHARQMPDDRLQPSQHALLSQMVIVPMLLITEPSRGLEIEASLEANLFESGSINPPARALLSSHANLESVHGQLLTLNDLLALQRVQLDSAGLSGFWEAVEATLMAPTDEHHLTLPGDLTACWKVDQGSWAVDFLTFNQWSQTHFSAQKNPTANSEQGYGLWVRAYRTLLALLDSHGIDWHVELTHPAVFDERCQCIIESGELAAENTPREVSGTHLTEHVDENLGVMAWTLIEEGRMMHFYPVTSTAIASIQADFAKRHIADTERHRGLCYNAANNKLKSHVCLPINPA